MKPLVIYHKGCLDGAGAALAAWLKFGEEAEYRAASYGDPAPTDDEVRGRDVFVLDFSYPRAELERIADAVERIPPRVIARKGELVVLDHHKTAQKDLEGLPFCIFDMNKSGAVLAWEHFNNYGSFYGAVHPLFEYIQDRDLWQWKLLHAKEISAALFATGACEDFRKLATVYRSWHGGPESREALITRGAGILAAEAQMVARIVSTAETVTLDGHRCLAVSCSVLQSEVGEALAIEGARRGLSPIGVVWHRNGAHGGVYRVSLRSRDIHGLPEGAPDVSAIAKKLDPKGGGHHRAAGFECIRLPWDDTVAQVREYIRGDWCTDDRMDQYEREQKRDADDLLLARIGATSEEIDSREEFVGNRGEGW